MSRLLKFKTQALRIVNALIRRSYWYNNVEFQNCKKFWRHNTFNLDVANLGSTSALNAFNYEGLPIKAANWALERNPLLADQEVLNNYFSFLNPNCSTLIICLCPFTSLSGSYDYFEDRYYTILRMTSIPHSSFRKKNEVLRRLHNPLFGFPLIYLFVEIFKIFTKLHHPKLTEERAYNDAKKWMGNWMKEFSISDFSYPLSLVNRDSIEDATTILNGIISFCRERNIRPAVLIPPVYHALGEMFTKEIRHLLIESLINGIEDKSVWYNNYMDDPSFTNDISLFQNSFLMNKKGAKLFTKRVLNDLGLL